MDVLFSFGVWQLCLIRMKIIVDQLLEGAKRSKGLVVIIDVFRATSLQCYLFSQGVKEIYPVQSLKEAFDLKSELQNAILFGERNFIKPEGFDFGNSPSKIKNLHFSSKKVIHTTSAGTKGIVEASKHSDDVITASFLNLDAVVRYVKDSNPEVLYLVPMGKEGVIPRDEDLLCAIAIKRKLENRNFDFDIFKSYLRMYKSGAKFFKNKKHVPREDFFYCLRLNLFDFVIRSYKEKNKLILRKIN